MFGLFAEPHSNGEVTHGTVGRLLVVERTTLVVGVKQSVAVS